MAKPTSREELKDYCLRRLGFPVIDINVSEDQLQDRIDEAIAFWSDYHYDAVKKVYWVKGITAQDVANRYFSVPESIIGITRIFPLVNTFNQTNMWDLRYQLRLNELWDFTSASYINYTMTMQHLRTLELLFTGEVPIRFNRHENRLYIDFGWGTGQAPEGQIVVSEGYEIIDASQFTDVWNDRWLLRYTTCLFKRQWGENLRKYGNISLPGGIVLNGETLYQDAIREIDELEKDIENGYSLPPEFLMG